MLKYLTSKNLSLLVINLIPLYGVLFLGWESMIVILFYVVETIMVGILHVLKMTAVYILNRNNPKALAVERKSEGVQGVGLIPFFIFHFGFFIFVQMMVFSGFTEHSFWSSVPTLFTEKYKYAIGALFITKLTILISELFWDPEIETKLPDDIFLEPYPRIVIQQFMVILGGWATIFGQGLLGYLIVLIALKTALDLVIANISKDRISAFLKKYEKKEG